MDEQKTRKSLIFKKIWFSDSCCRWLLSLGCIVLSVSLLSGCIENNAPSASSTKTASLPAAELTPPKSELSAEPESVPEPEPVFDNVAEPTPEPEPVSENITVSTTESEPVSAKVNIPMAEPEPVSENITVSTAESEPVSAKVTVPTSQPELAPEPEPEPILIAREYQRFGYYMEKSYLRFGKRVFSHLSISQILNPGEAVSGYVEFSDLPTGGHDGDYGYEWEMEVLDPDGKEIYSWTGNYGSQNNRKFFFRALDYGEYVINVGHYSAYEKILFMKISPTGWSMDHVDGDDTDELD